MRQSPNFTPTLYRIISDISPAPYWVSAILAPDPHHIRLALPWHSNDTHKPQDAFWLRTQQPVLNNPQKRNTHHRYSSSLHPRSNRPYRPHTSCPYGRHTSICFDASTMNKHRCASRQGWRLLAHSARPTSGCSRWPLAHSVQPACSWFYI